MAEASSSPSIPDPYPKPDNPPLNSNLPNPTASTSSAAQPNPNQPSVASPSPGVFLPPPPPPAVVPPVAPSFRPLPMSAPQFSPLPNPNYQAPPGVQPPGVSSAAPGTAPQPPMMQYQVPPGQVPNPAMRPFAPASNGFAAMPPHPGLPRYPPPYPGMVRPAFPARPLGVAGVLPPVSRPLVPVVPGVRPVTPPVVRPAVLPIVTPAEKPQTTVYIGKIAATVDNDFMLSLLQICGPVKSWKRPQDPTNGTPKGFGFFEFESAEGVLRALRLLNEFNIDGQQLKVNPTKETRESLERYIEKKTENSRKLKESQAAGPEKEKEGESASATEQKDPNPSGGEVKKEETDSGNKENHEITEFGIVTDEDREADREALEKLTNMIEERLKTNPLPPPPATDNSGDRNLETPVKLKDRDSDGDALRHDAGGEKGDREKSSEGKPTSEHNRPETGSPDRDKKHDRKSRDRDREQDLKREKERELERYEREAERERIRKEREQRRRMEEAEREFEEYLKEWEYRERERERQRQYEKEKEKEKRKRRREIIYDEEDDDDDSRKRLRRSALEDKKKRRQREKEEDLADRKREEEEIAEAKKRAEEDREQQREREAMILSSGPVSNETEKGLLAEQSGVDGKIEVERGGEATTAPENHKGDGLLQNGNGDASNMALVTGPATQQTTNAPARKLGFGLNALGKRAAVLSVFNEEEEDDEQKEKKMRPLVPIDYSKEELQAVQPVHSGAPNSNLMAAAEFAKRISNANAKDEKANVDERKRTHDRSTHRDRNENEDHRAKDGIKEKAADHDKDRKRGSDKLKTADNKKLLDAKQLIDMIPKTKEELFSFEVNWDVYDKHGLHERLRPWISKKITEFLGEEEATLVDYIVTSTQEHVKASQMLELLQSILDEEAEMFVLKMWRMLIFEIKKVETGLATK